jgi:hypothetical protein
MEKFGLQRRDFYKIDVGGFSRKSAERVEVLLKI